MTFKRNIFTIFITLGKQLMDIDEITLHSMEIIRKTVQAIISYSRYLCSSKTVRELQQILNDIITSLVF